MSLTLQGAAYSAYTRIVRLVLEEKALAYAFEEIDFISEGMGKSAHPFAKVPVLTHDGQRFFETVPICLYLEEAAGGPALLPEDAASRAHVRAAIAMLDNYIWPDIRELVTQQVFAPIAGGWPDDMLSERMEARLAKSLAAFAGHYGGGDWLVGAAFSLADCHFAPMMDYLMQTRQGLALMEERGELAAWWARMKKRDSLAATAFSLEAYPFAAKPGG